MLVLGCAVRGWACAITEPKHYPRNFLRNSLDSAFYVQTRRLFDSYSRLAKAFNQETRSGPWKLDFVQGKAGHIYIIYVMSWCMRRSDLARRWNGTRTSRSIGAHGRMSRTVGSGPAWCCLPLAAASSMRIFWSIASESLQYAHVEPG